MATYSLSGPFSFLLLSQGLSVTSPEYKRDNNLTSFIIRLSGPSVRQDSLSDSHTDPGVLFVYIYLACLFPSSFAPRGGTRQPEPKPQSQQSPGTYSPYPAVTDQLFTGTGTGAMMIQEKGSAYDKEPICCIGPVHLNLTDLPDRPPPTPNADL